MRLTRAVHPNPSEVNGMPPTYETMPMTVASKNVWISADIRLKGLCGLCRLVHSWFLRSWFVYIRLGV
jgi:hypothetical protein